MNRVALAVLVCAALFASACEEKEPPRAPNIPVEPDDQVGVQKDQTPPNTCIGEETDEEPDFDLAVHVTQSGARMDFHITAAEKKGLEVCTLYLRIHHNKLDESTGQWVPDGQSSQFFINRIPPGEIARMDTAVRDAEYPQVTEPGPPEAWSIVVERYSDVRKPPS